MIFKLKSLGVLILKCGRFILITIVNMFLLNGNLKYMVFLVNGKPFINKSHILCRFSKYALCIFIATPVRNNLPNVKTYYHHIKITCKKKKTLYGQSLVP